ncbi:MAG: AarF/ABC1/UbiB kinase family protein [Planctomycetes bacterium]|nr:AarF/ABC1/UbiB kinase family protein [Planctomycetota bacterium]
MGRPTGRLAPLKDLRRGSQIVSVFVQHGFGMLLSKRALEEVQVGDAADPASSDRPTAVRLREALEELGPTFVKLGQILSTRADIVPDDMAAALRVLQDNAPPIPFAQVEAVIEQELGAPISELYASFEREPLATASIAQVHRATLADEAGVAHEVAVKVQRPGIEDTMHADMSLLYWLARALEETIEEVAAYSPTAIVEAFEEAIRQELDFVHERQNLERAAELMRPLEARMVVPKVYPSRCARRVLTMEFLKGVKVTDVGPEVDRKQLLENLVEVSYHQIFEVGFFHGDPHPGNVFVLEDGRLGLLDFGLWGTLDSEQQDALAQWMLAVVLKNPSMLARLTLKVGQPPAGFDRVAYERDIRGLMDKYVGVNLKDLSSASILSDSVDVIRRHRIRIPPTFAILSRATATLEGIIRELYPEFDFQETVYPYAQRLMFRRFNVDRAGPEAMALLVGLQEFVNEVPGQLNQLLLDLSSGRFQVSLRGEAVEELSTVGRVHSVRLVLAMLAAGLIVAAGLTLAPYKQWVVPVLALLALGFVLFALTLTFVFPHGWQRIRLGKFMFWRR